MDAPRWLTPEQMDAWLELLGTMVWLPAALDNQLQRDAGLSHFEYQVLAILSAAPDGTRPMLELAAACNSSPSRLSHAAGRLERQGWIRRSARPENRRYVLATLTDDGRAKLASAAPGHVEAVQQYVFGRLTAEQVTQLAAIARSIRSAVKQ